MDDPTQQSILTQLEGRKSSGSRYLLLAAFLVMLVSCVLLSENSSLRNSKPFWISNHKSSISPSRLTSFATDTQTSSSIVQVRSGVGDLDDLFFCAPGDYGNCKNLTQSPVIQETWPVLNNSGQTLVYYGTVGAITEVYLLALPNGIGIPITTRVGNSGLHVRYEVAPVLPAVFSPDGRWLAYPAITRSDDDTLAVFITRIDDLIIFPVEHWVGHLVDYRWLDNEALIVAVVLSNDQVDFKKIYYNHAVDSFSLAEMP